jgi:invasion protein IalB
MIFKSLCVALLLLFGGEIAVAEQTVTEDGEQQTSEVWKLKAQTGSWQVFCNSNTLECRAIQRRQVGGNQQNPMFAEVVITKVDGGAALVWTLPFGIDFRPGIVIKVDDRDEFKGFFVTCFPQGCRAVVPMNDVLAKDVTEGKVMRVGFAAFGSEKTRFFEISLEGSAKAMQGVFDKAD